VPIRDRAICIFGDFEAMIFGGYSCFTSRILTSKVALESKKLF
jgi:hypothetical protein